MDPARPGESPHALRAALAHAGGRLLRFTLVSLIVCAVVAGFSWRFARGATLLALGAPLCTAHEVLVGRLEADGLTARFTFAADGSQLALFLAPSGRMAIVAEVAPGLACLVVSGSMFQPYRPDAPPPEPPRGNGA